jgi:hypothetical protein
LDGAEVADVDGDAVASSLLPPLFFLDLRTSINPPARITMTATMQATVMKGFFLDRLMGLGLKQL